MNTEAVNETAYGRERSIDIEELPINFENSRLFPLPE